MTFKTRGRYGGTTTFEDPSPEDIRAAIAGLISGLRTERFEEPDDEHTRTSLTHGTVYIEIQVNGMATLGDLAVLEDDAEPIIAEEVYLADIPDARMTEILTDLAGGSYAAVLAAGWGPKSALPAYKYDYYRRPEGS